MKEKVNVRFGKVPTIICFKTKGKGNLEMACRGVLLLSLVTTWLPILLQLYQGRVTWCKGRVSVYT